MGYFLEAARQAFPFIKSGSRQVPLDEESGLGVGGLGGGDPVATIGALLQYDSNKTHQIGASVLQWPHHGA